MTPLLVQQNGGIHIPFAHENDTLSLEKFTEFWVSTTLGTDGKLEDTKAEAIHLLKLFMGSDYSSKDLGLSYYAFYKLMVS